MDSQFIPIGRCVAAWGIHGELKVKVLTDFPERFAPGETLYINEQPLIIESCKWLGNMPVLKLSTIDSREEAERIRGTLLEIPSSWIRTLPEGEYYRFQLIGLDVYNTEGGHLGCISKIIQTGNNDVYEVPSAEGVILIPAIDDVVKSIDLANNRMIIEVIKGLI